MRGSSFVVRRPDGDGLPPPEPTHDPPRATPPSPAPAPDFASVARRWSDVARQALSQGDTDLGAALAGTRVVAFEGGVLTIVADDGRAMPADLDTRLRPYLALVGASGVRVGAAPAASGDERARKWQTAQAHPLVKDLIRRFEGDVTGREVATREEWLARLERRP